MDRRQFLKGVGALAGAFGSAGLLAACGRGAGAVPSGEPTWNLISGSFELLAGQGQRFAFGLTTVDNEPVGDADVEVFTRDVDGSVLGGPYATRYFPQPATGLGIYLALVDVPAPGIVELVAVSGQDYGTKAMNVVRPADSPAPAPGQAAPVTATPTPADPLGFAEVCTREPDCSMHELSLDAALGAGAPVVLLFATPAYCQTAVCGPAVDTLEDVRGSRDWGEVEFVHCEIFSDAGRTVGEPVTAWGLPSEPWLFTIGRDGRVVDRVDGPMIAEEIAGLVERLG